MNHLFGNTKIISDKPIGRLNIVSNVGQMFMFCKGNLFMAFGDVFGCCRAEVFVHRSLSNSRSVGPKPVSKLQE